ncbi:unnamed protein product [Dicrocoelium dendriticum]|nr:unnamed protein product [Dicrocoelium dendriticum]
MKPTVSADSAADHKATGSEDPGRNALEIELKQVEEDIQTLKDTLAVKVRRANEIKKLLGYTTLSTLQHDIMESVHKLEDTEAYLRTSQFISTAKDKTITVAQEAKEKVGSTISALKNSETVKNITEKVGSTYSTVKDALIHSTYGHPPDD